MTDSGCERCKRAIASYVDGELDASTAFGVEAHMAGCGPCAAEVSLGRAMKRSLRRASHESVEVTALRGRILHSMSQSGATGRTPTWVGMLPWAAAAAFAFAIGGGVRLAAESRLSIPSSSFAASASSAVMPMLDELAQLHARPLPPEERDPAVVSKVFSPIVGVPVRPAKFDRPSQRASRVSFSGARLMPMHDEPAATLFYDSNGTRVSVFVFDPRRITVRGALTPRHILVDEEPRTIWVGRAKGYAVAVAERDGVGYAVSADLTEREVIDIASGF